MIIVFTIEHFQFILFIASHDTLLEILVHSIELSTTFRNYDTILEISHTLFYPQHSIQYFEQNDRFIKNLGLSGNIKFINGQRTVVNLTLQKYLPLTRYIEFSLLARFLNPIHERSLLKQFRTRFFNWLINKMQQSLTILVFLVHFKNNNFSWLFLPLS